MNKEDTERILREQEEMRKGALENLLKSLIQINRTKFCGPGKFYDPESDMNRYNGLMFEYIRGAA